MFKMMAFTALGFLIAWGPFAGEDLSKKREIYQLILSIINSIFPLVDSNLALPAVFPSLETCFCFEYEQHGGNRVSR